MRRGIFLGLTGLFLPCIALAYVSPGAPTGYVNDFANVLSNETKQQLNAELEAFRGETSNEIAIAIVPSMQGDYIENFAVKLFEEWGIGGEKKDNGVLLLLSIQEREMRIEVGYGLEGALTDSESAAILATMTTSLREGDYNGAVEKGVRGIQEATRGEYQGDGASKVENAFEDWWWLFGAGFFALQWFGAILARSQSWWAGGIVGGLLGVFAEVFGISFGFFGLITAIGIGVGLLLDYVVSSAYKSAHRSGRLPPWWAGGGGFGGGRSGGFGGFGGGMSGGGGASGRW